MDINAINYNLYRNNLFYMKENGNLSPIFEVSKERAYFKDVLDNVFAIQPLKPSIEFYLNKKEKMNAVPSNICLNATDKQTCCKNFAPTNDFKYYTCLQEANKPKIKENIIFEIIFLLLINILIVSCCILPMIDLYKL